MKKMGQQVKGYRRNATHGTRTSRRGGRRGWREKVNPPYKDGWEKSGVERTEREYGKSEGRGKERRGRVEQVREGEGFVSNGRGRKGSRKKGYVVCGEYVKVLKPRVTQSEMAKRERLKEEQKHRTKQEKKKYKRGVKQAEWEKLQAKRGRRVRRYESEVGRKVTRERVNRAEVRVRRGRMPEMKRRVKVMGDRSYREKRKKEDTKEREGRVSKKRRKVRRVDEDSEVLEDGYEVLEEGLEEGLLEDHCRQGTKEAGRIQEETAREKKGLTLHSKVSGRVEEKDEGKKMEENQREENQSSDLIMSGEEKQSSPDSVRWEKVGKALEKSRKPEKQKVIRQGRAVVVVLAGVIKRERRRVKRRVRKREGAGRKHKAARRDFVGRMKYQGKKSVYGRRGGGYRRKWIEERGGDTVEGGFYGYKVTVVGTLDGSRRTKKTVSWMGEVPKSTKRAMIGVAEGVAKTTVGTMGVRVEYCYGLG